MLQSATRIVLGICLLVLPLSAQRDATDVTVRVIDLRREHALGQVRVDLTRFPEGAGAVQFTDATGLTMFNDVRVGAYVLKASLMGYKDTEVRLDIIRGENSKSIVIQMQAEESAPSGAPGDPISARELAIPPAALRSFQKGLELLNAKKDYKRSVEEFQRAVAAYPGYHEAYFGLGMAQVQLKAAKEAQEAFFKAIELKPTFLPPYYPLALLLSSQRRYADAEPLLRKAMELDAANWLYPFELARALGNQGKAAEALPLAEKAGAMTGAAPKVHLLLADLCSNTGNRARAIQELEMFLKLDPASPYAPAARKSLATLRELKD